MDFDIWMSWFTNPTDLIASSIVLYIVVCKRKRRELFLVLIPTFYMIQSGFWFFISVGQ